MIFAFLNSSVVFAAKKILSSGIKTRFNRPVRLAFFTPEVSLIGYQYCLMIKGKVKKFDTAPGGIEIIPSEIKILNKTPEKLPIDMTGETISELDLRLNNRALDLRSLRNQAIFEIRGEVLKYIRNFLREQDFTEITTPNIIGSATECGTELFPIRGQNND